MDTTGAASVSRIVGHDRKVQSITTLWIVERVVDSGDYGRRSVRSGTLFLITRDAACLSAARAAGVAR